MCAAAKMNDFKRIFGTVPVMVCDVLEFINKMNLGDWELNKAYEHFKYIGSTSCMRLVKKMIDEPNSPAMQALLSLVEFYRNHDEDELMLGDLEQEKNWGLAIRDGKEVLVIIDAGFSTEVYTTYYK